MVEEVENDPVELLHFKLRLTPEMHEKLKILAVQNKRTMSHEIVARLEGSFDVPPALPPGLLGRLRHRAGLRKRPAGKLLIDIVEDAVNQMEVMDEQEFREHEARLDELSETEFKKILDVLKVIRRNRDKPSNKTKK